MSLQNQTLFLDKLDEDKSSEYLFYSDEYPSINSIKIAYNPAFLQKLKRLVKNNKLNMVILDTCNIKDEDLLIEVKDEGGNIMTYEAIVLNIFNDDVYIKFCGGLDYSEFYEISINEAIKYVKENNNS